MHKTPSGQGSCLFWGPHRSPNVAQVSPAQPAWRESVRASAGVSPGVSRLNVFRIPEYLMQNESATRWENVRALARANILGWSFENNLDILWTF
jgi:hypothetical protein